MSWSTIASDEVLEQFTPGETAVLEKIQGANDSLPKILARVVRAARGCIAAGGNPLDTASDTIPDQLRSDVIALARWQWLISFPALKSMQTKERNDAATAAQSRLDKIADGSPKVELPPNATTAASPTQRPSFGTRTRNFTSAAQEG